MGNLYYDVLKDAVVEEALEDFIYNFFFSFPFFQKEKENIFNNWFFFLYCRFYRMLFLFLFVFTRNVLSFDRYPLYRILENCL